MGDDLGVTPVRGKAVNLAEARAMQDNSTGVTSGVTLVKKIELEIEHNVDKMEYSCIVPKIRVTEQYRKIQEVWCLS